MNDKCAALHETKYSIPLYGVLITYATFENTYRRAPMEGYTYKILAGLCIECLQKKCIYSSALQSLMLLEATALSILAYASSLPDLSGDDSGHLSFQGHLPYQGRHPGAPAHLEQSPLLDHDLRCSLQDGHGSFPVLHRGQNLVVFLES